jgi:hypothetical protein
MRLTAELLTRHVLSPRMTHSAIGSESCNVREMFTAPYPVVVFPPSFNVLYYYHLSLDCARTAIQMTVAVPEIMETPSYLQ